VSEFVASYEPNVDDEKRFQAMAFHAGITSAPSTRFWVFPEPNGAFASFGVSGAIRLLDGEMSISHEVLASARMDRFGWLNLMRTLITQLQPTVEEWDFVMGSDTAVDASN
jgi:hypothetical protein